MNDELVKYRFKLAKNGQFLKSSKLSKEAQVKLALFEASTDF